MKGIKGIEHNQTDLRFLFLTQRPKGFGLKIYIPSIPFIPVQQAFELLLGAARKAKR
jgi:hypothetical protein